MDLGQGAAVDGNSVFLVLLDAHPGQDRGTEMNFERAKEEIIRWGHLMNQKAFVTARSGNMSCKVNPKEIFVTAHDSYLGHLEKEDILIVDLEGNVLEGAKEITSEKLLHLHIHKQFAAVKAVLHAHPPYTVAFFHYFDNLDIFSFEARHYLGRLEVIPQASPTVSDTKPVIAAFERAALVVLKDHGVVSVGKDFREAFGLIELLEEQAKVNLVVKGKTQG